MATQWIVKTDAEPAGPFDLNQMRSLAVSGQLLKTHHVQRVGSDDWREAGRVIAFWSAPSDSGVAASGAMRSVAGHSDTVRTAQTAGDSPTHLPGIAERPSTAKPRRRRSIRWTLTKAGLVFGPLCGHLIYDLKAYLAWQEYRDQNPTVEVEATHNYFNLPHWEHLLIGLLVGVVIAGIAALFVKPGEQSE